MSKDCYVVEPPRKIKVSPVQFFLSAVEIELRKASEIHAPINSLHEGYGVIQEEVDEFWDEVKLKAADRDPTRTLKELVQVAAMACRCATDVVLK